MKELLIRGNTWCYYHRKAAIAIFILSCLVVWFGSGAIQRALSPTGDIVFLAVVFALYIAFIVYVLKHSKELDARKTKV